tara:strand:+ start:9219 stop:10352 length:1134 start_codon:yes stop_codon:yes gene_type:complete
MDGNILVNTTNGWTIDLEESEKKYVSPEILPRTSVEQVLDSMMPGAPTSPELIPPLLSLSHELEDTNSIIPGQNVILPLPEDLDGFEHFIVHEASPNTVDTDSIESDIATGPMYTEMDGVDGINFTTLCANIQKAYNIMTERLNPPAKKVSDFYNEDRSLLFEAIRNSMRGVVYFYRKYPDSAATEVLRKLLEQTFLNFSQIGSLANETEEEQAAISLVIGRFMVNMIPGINALEDKTIRDKFVTHKVILSGRLARYGSGLLQQNRFPEAFLFIDVLTKLESTQAEPLSIVFKKRIRQAGEARIATFGQAEKKALLEEVTKPHTPEEPEGKRKRRRIFGNVIKRSIRAKKQKTGIMTRSQAKKAEQMKNNMYIAYIN